MGFGCRMWGLHGWAYRPCESMGGDAITQLREAHAEARESPSASASADPDSSSTSALPRPLARILAQVCSSLRRRSVSRIPPTTAPNAPSMRITTRVRMLDEQKLGLSHWPFPPPYSAFSAQFSSPIVTSTSIARPNSKPGASILAEEEWPVLVGSGGGNKETEPGSCFHFRIRLGCVSGGNACWPGL